MKPSDIPRFLEKQEEYDIVVGSRFQAERSLNEWTPLRKGITYLGHFLTKTLLRLPYDATGAFLIVSVGSHSEPAITDGSVRKDYEFFFESLAIFHTANLKIGEIPVVLPARTYGHSKMQFSHMIRGIRRLYSSRSICSACAVVSEHQQTGNFIIPSKTAEEWNEYWGQMVLAASGIQILPGCCKGNYRKYLIKGTLNHFIAKDV